MLLLLPNTLFGIYMYAERDEPTAVSHTPSPTRVSVSQCRFFSAPTASTPCLSTVLGCVVEGATQIHWEKSSCRPTRSSLLTDLSFVRLILCTENCMGVTVTIWRNYEEFQKPLSSWGTLLLRWLGIGKENPGRVLTMMMNHSHKNQEGKRVCERSTFCWSICFAVAHGVSHPSLPHRHLLLPLAEINISLWKVLVRGPRVIPKQKTCNRIDGELPTRLCGRLWLSISADWASTGYGCETCSWSAD